MKVLFLTIGSFSSINAHGIYPDLLREFLRHGHEVYVICACERRTGLPTVCEGDGGTHILRVSIGNITQTNLVEKGISTVLIKRQYLSALKKYYRRIKFDLVLYPTPPITLCGVVEYIKKWDGAKTYLLLKDIFPQNAVDLGMMNASGIKSILYRYFRSKEKQLYKVSDRIGCMSEANVEYVLNHNPEVRMRNEKEKKKSGKSIVEVCPNCIEPIDMSISMEERKEIRTKYNIPLDKVIFIYGGNLGKPQGIEFMLQCLHSQSENDQVFFLITGNGTEYGKVEQYVEKYKPNNIVLHQWLPKDEYDKVVAACDVGMIFLDHRFTIPNFPSRLLSYMSAKLPVLAVTDTATDIGNVIVENGFGWWCESNGIGLFCEKVNEIADIHMKKMQGAEVQHLELLTDMGENARRYLIESFSVEEGYEIIMKHMESKDFRAE